MDGICGCLVKLSADGNQIRSNDECQSCYQILIVLSSLPTGYQRLEMIDYQSLTTIKEAERKLQRDTRIARSSLFKASLVHRLRSPLPIL